MNGYDTAIILNHRGTVAEGPGACLMMVRDGKLVTPPVTVTKYKVEINSQPWSYFTVDADPTKHQTPATLSLTPGPHTIKFFGNEHFPADKTKTITVPENNGFRLVEKLTAPAP